MAGLKSFMYGKSMCNQRIEAWWGILRRQGVHWWINLFKDLIDAGMYDSLDPVHAQCLKFCFMDVIQAELDRIAMHWNVHEIRAQKGYSEMLMGNQTLCTLYQNFMMDMIMAQKLTCVMLKFLKRCTAFTRKYVANNLWSLHIALNQICYAPRIQMKHYT